MTRVSSGELEGRVALVTGATRGIGKAAAIALAQAGAHVVLTGRTRKDGDAAVAEIKGAGGSAAFVELDVTDRAATQRLFESLDRLDIFVANAGISVDKTAALMSLAEFRQIMAVNLEAVFVGLQHAVTAMRKGGRGGSAILMSSIMGKIAAPGYMHYCAAKVGLTLMAKSAALELGAEGIRVNSVHPGLVRTDMTAAFPENMMAQLIPMGRFGNPEEIATGVVFLASDRSKFMTGAEMVIDGAMSIR